MMWKQLGGIIGLLFLAPLPLFANLQSHDRIRERAIEYIHKELAAKVKGEIHTDHIKIDSRLNLSSCPDKKLEVFNPYASPLLGNATLGVRCKAKSTPWTVYITTKTSVFQPVLVAIKPIRKGEPLNSNNTALLKFDIARCKKGYFNNEQDIENKVSIGPIPQGEAIPPAMIVSAIHIKRGSMVSIEVQEAQFKIAMKGTALKDGRLGDTIPVRNNSSKRVVEGEIVGHGQVRISMR